MFPYFQLYQQRSLQLKLADHSRRLANRRGGKCRSIDHVSWL